MSMVSLVAIALFATGNPDQTDIRDLALSCPSPRILVMTKTAGFRHDAIPVAIENLKTVASSRHVRLDFTEDSAHFTDSNLAKYDGILFLSTTGDILNDPQQEALVRFVRSGKGFIGVHAATDTEHDWPWYRQMIGAHFKSHPPGTHKFKLKVDDRANPATVELPDGYTRTDEWYEFKEAVVPHAEILMTVAESTPQTPSIKAGHPVMWKHDFEGGRVWYTSMGHTKETFGEPMFMTSLLEGMVWACQGRKPSNVAPIGRVPFAQGDGWAPAGESKLSPDAKTLVVESGTTGLWNQNGAKGGAPFLTTQEFGDCLVHLEFMIPKDGNSGVYLQGRYEVQIRDSFGIPLDQLQHSDCGGIYQRWKDDKGFEGAKPLRQAARPAGKWQTLDILFRAPRFDNTGKRTVAACFAEVRLNGVVVQKNAVALGPTRASMFEDEKPVGPIMIQGDHGPLVFRNFWVKPMKL